jgi:hypothetical protein
LNSVELALKRERAKDLTLKFPVYLSCIFFFFELAHYLDGMLLHGWESRDISSSGHSAVYAGIWLYALITMYFCNAPTKNFHVSNSRIMNSLFSFVYSPKKLKNIILPVGLVMMMVGLCEGMFNIAYYIILVPNNQLRFAVAYSGIIAYGTLALLLVSAFIPMWFKLWRALNFQWFLISLLAFFMYLVNWMFLPYLLGYGFFPITINATIGMTAWYHSYWVNAIEIFSWWIYILPATIAFLKGSKELRYEHSFIYRKIHRV